MIWPPSPFSHTRTHAEDRRGLPSSMNEGCHTGEVWDEDATFWVAGMGSRMVIPLDGWGGVLVGASPELGWACSTVRGPLRWRLGGGGGGGDCTWVGGGCYCSGACAPSTKRLIDITFLVTISGSTPEDWTDSVAASSSCAGASGSVGEGLFCLTCWCASSWRWRDTRSADLSLMGASSSEQVYRGPRSRVSPTINLRGRKFACRTSMYERRGLSTSKACPSACQVEYIGSSSRIKWDARSCPSQWTKISDLNIKFRSRTWTTRKSFLNLLVSV